MRFLNSIKFRLTVWYVAAMIVLLLVFSGMALFLLAHGLSQGLDESLKARAVELQSSMDILDGRIVIGERLNELVWFYSASGDLLARFGPGVEMPGISGVLRDVGDGRSSFATVLTSDGQEIRLYGTKMASFGGQWMVVVGRPTAEVAGVLRRFGYMLGISLLAVVLLGGVGGMVRAWLALRPVEHIARIIGGISEHSLSRRVAVRAEDELGRLGQTLDKMMERLEAAFERQRQFTSDASHELRTPLAVIEAESTLALSKERSSEEYRKSLELVAQETAHMSAIIERLLFLARSDGRREKLHVEGVDVGVLLREVSGDVEVLCRDKGLDCHLGPVEEMVVQGDRVELKQLFLNLLDNAVRYTPNGGGIRSSAVRNGKSAVVCVTDSGVGISEEHLPHVFERFYRVDEARSRADGGTGLGLAIARSIAETHGGKIEVTSEVGRGSTFRVTLPLYDNGREHRSDGQSGDDRRGCAAEPFRTDGNGEK